jgi:hypothetical protein
MVYNDYREIPPLERPANDELTMAAQKHNILLLTGLQLLQLHNQLHLQDQPVSLPGELNQTPQKQRTAAEPTPAPVKSGQTSKQSAVHSTKERTAMSPASPSPSEVQSLVPKMSSAGRSKKKQEDYDYVGWCHIPGTRVYHYLNGPSLLCGRHEPLLREIEAYQRESRARRGSAVNRVPARYLIQLKPLLELSDRECQECLAELTKRGWSAFPEGRRYSG